MSCPFYGRFAARTARLLVATGGNQCGLIPETYTSCSMTSAGSEADWEQCDLNGCRRGEEFLKFPTTNHRHWAHQFAETVPTPAAAGRAATPNAITIRRK
jgi:hypothetical protein